MAEGVFGYYSSGPGVNTLKAWTQQKLYCVFQGLANLYEKIDQWDFKTELPDVYQKLVELYARYAIKEPPLRNQPCFLKLNNAYLIHDFVDSPLLHPQF